MWICDHIGSGGNSVHEHMKLAHNKRYEQQCYMCTFTSKTKARLKSHGKNFHKNIEIDLSCEWCGFRANDLEEVEEHAKNTRTGAGVAEQHGCDHCQFSTYHKPTLDAHTDSVHQRNNCELCSFQGSNRTALANHMRIKHNKRHSERNMHKCYLCTLTTNYLHYLKNHIKNIHGDIKVDLVCKWCKFQADGLKSIEEHVKEAHLQEPHWCDQCDWFFILLSAYTRSAFCVDSWARDLQILKFCGII